LGYSYKKYGLSAAISRHNELATGYAATAVKVIDQLLVFLEQEKEEERQKGEKQ